MRVVKKAEVRREEILQTAAQIFREKGFLHTTTGDLIGRLGISRGLLYYHFRDLEDIAEQLTEGWIADLKKLAKHLPYDREQDARSKVWALADAAAALPEGEDPYLTDLMRRKLMPVLKAALLPILREGSYEGRFRVEEDEATATFLAAGLLSGGGASLQGRALVRRVLGDRKSVV